MGYRRSFVKQVVLSAVLLAIIMGLASVDWLGLPVLEQYTVFFLSAELDPAVLRARLSEWVERTGLDAWWPPWRRWWEPGGPAEPPGEGSGGGGASV